MSITAIRKKLHSYLEVAEDKKVKAIYAIMQEEVEEAAIVYSEDVKTVLDHRYAGYKSGKAKTLSATESKKRIRKILRPGNKK